jgi:hypothetical protein
MEAITKVAELQKTLAEQKKKLDDTQTKRTRSLQTKALDDSKDTLDKEMDNQKDTENKKYQLISDTYDKLKADIDTFVQAGINANSTMIDSILSDFNNLKTQFDSTTSTMGSIFETNFISKLNEAKEQLKLLGNGEVNTNSSDYGTSFIIDQMKKNSSQYGNATSEQKKNLANENLQYGTSLGWHRDEKGVWYDQYGNNAYNTYPLDKTQVINQMKSNSSQYASATPEKKKELADSNLKLGKTIGWTRDSSGNWYDESGNKVDLSKFATGTNDVVSMVGEQGRELRILNPNGKDSIIPNGITENLVKIGTNPLNFMNSLIPQFTAPQLTPVATNNGINVTFGNLLNVGSLSNIGQGELLQMTRTAANEAVTIIQRQLYRQGQR